MEQGEESGKSCSSSQGQEECTSNLASAEEQSSVNLRWVGGSFCAYSLTHIPWVNSHARNRCFFRMLACQRRRSIYMRLFLACGFTAGKCSKRTSRAVVACGCQRRC